MRTDAIDFTSLLINNIMFTSSINLFFFFFKEESYFCKIILKILTLF